ncbi:fatty acid desaturase family protein [Pleomorphovibrio marinus]|uniref:fatty acid desaturase family protein n=1 Tax=Pleomorphovibrio marinus TaxID=2164132 RepID=UPI000E0B97DB|nr:acyl-CoA desaturase [Pleomorphovibrio marinus]
MRTLKFSKSKRSDFLKVLRERVDDYFKTNGITRYGNRNMVIKTIFMLSLLFIPILILNLGVVDNPWVLFGLYLTSGLGMAGVGMGVMHDAIHGSYSKSRTVNKYLGYTMNLIGANANVWKVQHNVLHHTYTNIDHADDDINAPFFLRFSPNAKRYWLHKFQHLYIWIFYGLSTVSWITTKDFIRIKRYHRLGFFNGKGELNREIVKIVLWKALYFSYTLVLPLIMVPLPAWMVILAFLSMHVITGLSISLVFQTAHIMPDTSFPKPDEDGIMENDWAVHQLLTTTNFAPRSRFFSWLIGGLNFQVEHHLLPNICHVHYPKLSKIVSQTAKEFELPYYVKKNFAVALRDHVKMLYTLGRV